MSQLTRTGKKVGEVRRLALRLVADLPQKDRMGEVSRLHEYVRDSIRYVRDIAGVETLHTVQRIMEQGQGDCDDKAVLLGALLGSLGYPTRYVAVGFKPGRYSHVLVEAEVGGRWVPLETTEPVAMGWSPPGVMSRMYIVN